MGQQQHDNYPTPERLARFICNTLRDWIRAFSLPEPQVIIEPSSGEGNFVKAAREFWPGAAIIACDIVGTYRHKVEAAGANVFVHGDWMEKAEEVFRMARNHGGRILVVGNPPFSFAQQHIEMAMSFLEAQEWLAFLLRLGFLGSAERAHNFWPHCGRQNRFILPIAGRPSYVKFQNVEVVETVDGVDYTHRRRKKKSTTDNSEYGSFIFEKGYAGPCIRTDPLIWKEQRRAA